jgi:hypothetical protein
LLYANVTPNGFVLNKFIPLNSAGTRTQATGHMLVGVGVGFGVLVSVGVCVRVAVGVGVTPIARLVLVGVGVTGVRVGVGIGLVLVAVGVGVGTGQAPIVAILSRCTVLLLSFLHKPVKEDCVSASQEAILFSTGVLVWFGKIFHLLP